VKIGQLDLSDFLLLVGIVFSPFWVWCIAAAARDAIRWRRFRRAERDAALIRSWKNRG
jgi:hypothetical protein